MLRTLIDHVADFQLQADLRFKEALEAISQHINGLDLNEVGVVTTFDEAEESLRSWKRYVDWMQIWCEQESNQNWVRTRKLVEEFACHLLELQNAFVIGTEEVAIKNFPPEMEIDLRVVSLNLALMKSPTHWCLLAHEIGHEVDIGSADNKFFSRLPPEKKRIGHGRAIQVWLNWIYEIVPDFWACRRVGPGYVTGFYAHTKSKEPDLNVGSVSHPPPNLRIMLMNRLLLEDNFQRGMTHINVLHIDQVSQLLMNEELEQSHPQGYADLFDIEFINAAYSVSHSFIRSMPVMRDTVFDALSLLDSGQYTARDLVIDMAALAISSIECPERTQDFIAQISNVYGL